MLTRYWAAVFCINGFLSSSLALTASAQEFDAQTHNLNDYSNLIGESTYHLGEDGFRITEVENCIIYDHQASFRRFENTYEIDLVQIIFDLRNIEEIDAQDSGSIILRTEVNNPAYHSRAVVRGTSDPSTPNQLRIMGLNETLWGDFLANNSDQLTYLYREATGDGGATVTEISVESAEMVEWDFTRFIEFRRAQLNERLIEYFSLCRSNI